MRTISSWRDMEVFGFTYLTGESCAFSMRGLIDLTDGAAETWRAYIGLPATAPLAKNWNGSSGGVASCTVAHSALIPLATFVLLWQGYEVVVDVRHSVIGMSLSDWELLKEEINTQPHRVYRQPTTPQHHGRNIHAMSGRVD